MSTVHLITLDPGHFHASLVQRNMYAGVDPTVYVFAPGGDSQGDLDEHLKRIASFNSRAETPTHWTEQIYTGPDYLDRMLTSRPGNVVVLAGNHARATDYILRSVESGLNVLADKPMAINPDEFEKLKLAFQVAERNNVLLYDIMTERYEITTVLQRELSRQLELFGELEHGDAENPAITKESTHHFSKTVAGAPLKRPGWFFDVRQEGDGIVDVATHLVDLIQWEAFPEQILHPSDATVASARRWVTPIARDQFERVTSLKGFPSYLRPDVKGEILEVYSNGVFTYRLRDVWAKVSVTWNFEAPPGAGDMHYSMMRGTKARLVIRQGPDQGYKPLLYIEPAANSATTLEERLKFALSSLQAQYPDLSYRKEASGFSLVIPDRYNIGHEAHFAQVTENYLRYLRAGKLPEWEVPNMITKYATIMQAYVMSR